MKTAAELLEIAANFSGYFGSDPVDWDAYADEWKHADDPADMLKFVKGEGLEFVSFGDPGDSMDCFFEDGELRLTFYISTRGGLYQAGAYDGEKQYGASNLGFHGGFAEHPEPKGEWKEYPGYPCARIAQDAWNTVKALK